MSLKETTIDSQFLVKSGFIEVRRDKVRLPDGKESTREYCVHPGAVVILPILSDGQLVLERQYRYPVHQVMIEFPAGKLDHNEPSIMCAKRELLEETGYTANRWAFAGHIYPCIGYSNEVIDVWLATNLIEGNAQLDDGEFVEVFSATFEQVKQWVLDGTLTDGKTLSCLNWLNAWQQGQWEPQWQSF